MIDHVTTYTTHYDVAKAFYEAVLSPLGSTLQVEMQASWEPDWPERRMCAFGRLRPQFWVLEVREPPHNPCRPRQHGRPWITSAQAQNFRGCYRLPRRAIRPRRKL